MIGLLLTTVHFSVLLANKREKATFSQLLDTLTCVWLLDLRLPGTDTNYISLYMSRQLSWGQPTRLFKLSWLYTSMSNCPWVRCCSILLQKRDKQEEDRWHSNRSAGWWVVSGYFKHLMVTGNYWLCKAVADLWHVSFTWQGLIFSWAIFDLCFSCLISSI